MALDIKKHNIETEMRIGSGTAQALARAETLVPGAGREAIEVMLADALASVDSAETQTDRAVVEGAVRCQAAYRLGDELTLRSVEAQTRFSQVFDMPGATPGMTLRACCCVEHVDARYENGHMVFLVTVSVSAQAFCLTPAELITGAESEAAVETRFEEIRTCRITAETTALHSLREETTLPAALDARTSLMEWGDVLIESAESDLGGIRVKGRLYTETLISSGVEGRPAASMRNTFDFEQLVEVPEWLAEDIYAEAELKRIGTRVEQGGEREDSVLITEADIGVRVTSIGRDNITALTDAYSVSGPRLEISGSECILCEDTRLHKFTENLKGTLLLSENAPGVGNVITVAVHPNISSPSENAENVLEGIIEATVLYMPGGSDAAASARSEMPFSIKAPCPISKDSMVCIKVLGAEASTLMSDRVELKCTLGISVFNRNERTSFMTTEITETEALKKRPGIILVWPSLADDIWSIGKRYSISAADVQRMNGGSDSVDTSKALMIKI